MNVGQMIFLITAFALIVYGVYYVMNMLTNKNICDAGVVEVNGNCTKIGTLCKPTAEEQTIKPYSQYVTMYQIQPTKEGSVKGYCKFINCLLPYKLNDDNSTCEAHDVYSKCVQDEDWFAQLTNKPKPTSPKGLEQWNSAIHGYCSEYTKPWVQMVDGETSCSEMNYGSIPPSPNITAYGGDGQRFVDDPDDSRKCIQNINPRWK